MGTDCHLHCEVKINGQWHNYSYVKLPRDYQLFSRMAGVRGSQNPISKPKGLPSDVSIIAKRHSDIWGVSGHSHSWLSIEEIEELSAWAVSHYQDLILSPECDWWGYLFGSKWNQNDIKENVEDARFVFWFDC